MAHLIPGASGTFHFILLVIINITTFSNSSREMTSGTSQSEMNTCHSSSNYKKGRFLRQIETYGKVFSFIAELKKKVPQRKLAHTIHENTETDIEAEFQITEISGQYSRAQEGLKVKRVVTPYLSNSRLLSRDKWGYIINVCWKHELARCHFISKD
uniref:Uncharacterized protein n=1 Tax=Octopus bimaculoides TaxID=37653 RepID=A0A0L8HTF4_OCTBM